MPRDQTTADASRRLARAVLRGNIDAAREAVRAGGRHEDSLIVAASLGYADLVDLLLEAGASATYAYNRPGLTDNPQGHTALFTTGGCGSPAIAQRLIDAGASVSIRTAKGDTPLHAFAEGGHPAGARVLLDAGAEIDAANNFGETPLMKAVRQTKTSTVAFLLRAGANQGLKDSMGWQAIHLAAQAGDLGVVGVLMEADHAVVNTTVPDTGRTPLHVAAINGHAALIGFLLRQGAPVSALDGGLMTPLWWAVWGKHITVVAEILASLVEQQDDDMPALDAALALEGRGGLTALDCACASGTLKIVDMLLHHGANETHRDSDGLTPSSYAAVEEAAEEKLFATNFFRRLDETEVASEDDEEEERKAIVRSLARGPAFRARSFLWPRAVVEDSDRRPWKVRPICARRRRGQKRFLFMPSVARYIHKSASTALRGGES